ncbi:MAG: VanW family protein [Clostridia bacterium]|nr:VanW family protein [Clostridia bacterium]
MVTKVPKNTVIEEVKEQPEKIVEVKEESQIITNTENEKKGLSTVTLFLILFGVFLLILISSFMIFAFSLKGSSNIFSGIYIKNVDVSNLNKQDAKNKIDNYIKNNIPEEITLKHGDYETTISTSELDIKFDTKSAVAVAYNFGRSGNVFSDGFEVLGNMFFNKNVEPTLSFNEESLTKILKDISTKLPDKLIESGYYIDGNNLILNKGTEGNIINVEAMSKVIKDNIQSLNLNGKIDIITQTAKPDLLDVNKIYNEVHKDPVDASFTLEPRSVTPSKNGIDFAITLDEAKSKLKESEKECVIPLKVVYPNVTTNMIGNEAFPDELSRFSTNYAASNTNRTTNLVLAAGKINGTVLMPGETFSYNQVVGERTIAAGYKEAPIYVSGRVEDGLGGGICQITTTLYNAVVYANLEIVERTNHQFVPSYVGAGRDATVVYGAIDFKFKNNRNYPIKIVCSVGGGVASFQILGLKTNNEYNVEITSRITSQTANNINSETYKILRQNGVVVEQKLLSKDIYKKH